MSIRTMGILLSVVTLMVGQESGYTDYTEGVDDVNHGRYLMTQSTDMIITS